MSNLKTLALLLLSVAFLASCEKESDEGNNNNNNTSDAPITDNRWKNPDTWEDYCDTITQTISGQEFVTFKQDKTVQYDLELIGNTYGCTGDSETIGSWNLINGTYIMYSDGDTAIVELAADGSEICIYEDGIPECWDKE